MGIYTSDVHQTSNGKWAFVITLDGRQQIRGAGYETEAEAVAALKKCSTIIPSETDAEIPK